jgi:chromosome segregation ATPase
MTGTLKTVLLSVLFFVVGLGISALGMWGYYRVQMADLERERDNAKLQMITMQEQWEQAVNELNQTKVVLNDTYAALELLRKYQSVDRDIQEDIDDLEDTLDPEGNATEDTYDEFRRMMEEFNQLQGNIPTASNGAELEILTLDPFVELREDAEELFVRVTDMVLEYQ